ncbi:MAG: pyrimidine-nucleoside phosphorylase [Caldisericota bacterium]|nr:pyrimidine-nucleoside phosphorylase [Caldisericota bacterium]
MNIVDIIEQKKRGTKLLKEEIDFFVQGYSDGTIPDYQISALLMAIWFNGMDSEETTELTLAMVRSGKTLDLSQIRGIKVDKHSSGGVADTVSLPLVALVAANGVPVAKMSGRGLGYSGGTIDKLEAISNFKVELPIEEFIDHVNRNGGAIIAQSNDLVVADKKLYALRDVTGTVDSIPLIAASIMSKKIAAGSDAVLLDVKVGDGAFVKNLEDAKRLAKIMVDIGTLAKRETVAYITDMNQPLGDAIGNSIEVEEAIEVLKGGGGKRLVRVIEMLGAEMLRLGGKVQNETEGQHKIQEAIHNGAGLRKFKVIIQAQGGDVNIIEDFSLLPQAQFKIPVLARESGYISAIKAETIGRLAVSLGAGRTKKGEKIDLAVGILFPKKVGDFIQKDEEIALILASDAEKGDRAAKAFLNCVELKKEQVKPLPLFYYRISKEEIKKLSDE